MSKFLTVGKMKWLFSPLSLFALAFTLLTVHGCGDNTANSFTAGGTYQAQLQVSNGAGTVHTLQINGIQYFFGTLTSSSVFTSINNNFAPGSFVNITVVGTLTTETQFISGSGNQLVNVIQASDILGI